MSPKRCKCEKVGGLTKPLRKQVAFATAGSKKLLAVHSELAWHKVKANFLDEALKVSRKKVAAIKGVFEKQKGPVGRCLR